MPYMMFMQGFVLVFCPLVGDESDLSSKASATVNTKDGMCRSVSWCWCLVDIFFFKMALSVVYGLPPLLLVLCNGLSIVYGDIYIAFRCLLNTAIYSQVFLKLSKAQLYRVKYSAVKTFWHAAHDSRLVLHTERAMLKPLCHSAPQFTFNIFTQHSNSTGSPKIMW